MKTLLGLKKKVLLNLEDIVLSEINHDPKRQIPCTV